MYGGVATPLALLHQGDAGSGRAKLLQNRSNSREENYSGVSRNAMRLPPLREAGHRDHNNGCENEPLLPSLSCKGTRNGKKLPYEENLPHLHYLHIKTTISINNKYKHHASHHLT